MSKKHYSPIICSCLCCKSEIRTSDLATHLFFTNQYLFPKIPPHKIVCELCGKITFNYKKKRFCSLSCAAKSNNLKRPTGHESRTKNNISRAEKLTHNKKVEPNKRPEYTKVRPCSTCGKYFSGRRKTCSDACLSKSLKSHANNKQTHPCNRASIDYNGIKLGSSYELAVAMSLDENNIKWIKPKPMPYHDNTGRKRQYFADFYLPKFNVFLDPKNDYLINNINPYYGYSDIDKISWASKENGAKIIILNKNQLSWVAIKALL